MAELESILARLRERGDELKALGPGRVVVAPVNHLSEVRLLRECRELLTPAEQLELRHAIIEMTSHLHGIVVAPAPPSSGLFERFNQVLRGGTPVEKGPVALAPPQGLIDAAEAWAIAELTHGRADVDVEPLTAPWQNATIVPDD